jgi:hypothetical protein
MERIFPWTLLTKPEESSKHPGLFHPMAKNLTDSLSNKHALLFSTRIKPQSQVRKFGGIKLSTL